MCLCSCYAYHSAEVRERNIAQQIYFVLGDSIFNCECANSHPIGFLWCRAPPFPRSCGWQPAKLENVGIHVDWTPSSAPRLHQTTPYHTPESFPCCLALSFCVRVLVPCCSFVLSTFTVTFNRSAATTRTVNTGNGSTTTVSALRWW